MSDSKKVFHNTCLEGFAILTLCGSSNDVNKQEDLRYLLSPNEETIIGRSPECRITVDPEQYTTVSRYHARIRLVTNNSQSTWEISNLSATNGTYINGKQIKEYHTLQPGDVITLSINNTFNIIMMTAGSSVTSALSPILPELAAAKIAVGTINSVLDAIDIF